MNIKANTKASMVSSSLKRVDSASLRRHAFKTMKPMHHPKTCAPPKDSCTTQRLVHHPKTCAPHKDLCTATARSVGVQGGVTMMIFEKILNI